MEHGWSSCREQFRELSDKRVITLWLVKKLSNVTLCFARAANATEATRQLFLPVRSLDIVVLMHLRMEWTDTGSPPMMSNTNTCFRNGLVFSWWTFCTNGGRNRQSSVHRSKGWTHRNEGTFYSTNHSTVPLLRICFWYPMLCYRKREKNCLIRLNLSREMHVFIISHPNDSWFDQ